MSKYLQPSVATRYLLMYIVVDIVFDWRAEQLGLWLYRWRTDGAWSWRVSQGQDKGLQWTTDGSVSNLLRHSVCHGDSSYPLSAQIPQGVYWQMVSGNSFFLGWGESPQPHQILTDYFMFSIADSARDVQQRDNHKLSLLQTVCSRADSGVNEWSLGDQDCGADNYSST